VTAGDAFEDFVFADLPRLPRAGEELKTSAFARSPGGGPIITAVAAARLGLTCRIIAAVGPGWVRSLSREGVGVVNVRKRGEPLGITAAISTRTDRAFVTFPGVNDRIEPRIMRAVRRVSARHVHFALQPARCSRWVPVVRALRRRGVTTSWDFGWSDGLARDRGLRQLAAAVDILFLNAAEARLYRGIRADTTIVKLGRKGARIEMLRARTGERMTAPRVRAIETTGAGDVFNGAFLAAFLDGRSLRECARAANIAAARSTRGLGGLA
jgi:sugar/nucleoside kinase (ribokinase family)